MARNEPFRNKVIGVREQLAQVRGLFPHFRSGLRGGMLQIEGDFRPTDRSVDYHVRIEYEINESPRVWVLSPKLEPREQGGGIKHMYPGNRLCLYMPHSGEWAADKWLARTIIPWTAEWLFHYEIWHATGVWCGGGVDPRDRTPFRKLQGESKNE